MEHYESSTIRKFIAISAHIKTNKQQQKLEEADIRDLTVQLKVLEKKTQTHPGGVEG